MLMVMIIRLSVRSKERTDVGRTDVLRNRRDEWVDTLLQILIEPYMVTN